jgi:hypothetical protein
MSLNRKGAPSRKVKKKIANTNRMALQPLKRISNSTSGSVNRRRDVNLMQGILRTVKD